MEAPAEPTTILLRSDPAAALRRGRRFMALGGAVTLLSVSLLFSLGFQDFVNWAPQEAEHLKLWGYVWLVCFALLVLGPVWFLEGLGGIEQRTTTIDPESAEIAISRYLIPSPGTSSRVAAFNADEVEEIQVRWNARELLPNVEPRLSNFRVYLKTHGGAQVIACRATREEIEGLTAELSALLPGATVSHKADVVSRVRA